VEQLTKTQELAPNMAPYRVLESVPIKKLVNTHFKKELLFYEFEPQENQQEHYDLINENFEKNDHQEY